ncbi:MAG: hypothetical protein H0U74_17190 [Bradymonadaceae bacterium]|nr:hypothetical protein [Lujinxingiaceae bacterium]
MKAQRSPFKHAVLGSSALQAAFILAFTTWLVLAMAGCTIIRDGNNNNNGNNTNNVVVTPKVVDMLVLVDLDRGSANLSSHYHNILLGLIGSLTLKHIDVRSAALAPLYHRAGAVVPLIYGEGESGGEFSNFGEAIAFYTYDDSNRYLQDRADADGENLAALGLDLGRRAIYRPETANPQARPYFQEAADGFIVVYLTAGQRPCAATDAACQLDGKAPAAYFTAKNSEQNAAWLELAGDSGVQTKRIFHLAIVTPEGVSYDAFSRACTGYPDFPATMLDVMEPSPKAYYGPFVQALQSGGGKGTMIDLCQAMSSRSEALMLGVGNQVRQMF